MGYKICSAAGRIAEAGGPFVVWSSLWRSLVCGREANYMGQVTQGWRSFWVEKMSRLIPMMAEMIQNSDLALQHNS